MAAAMAPAGVMERGLLDLEPQCLAHVFSYLEPAEAAACCCLCKLTRSIICDDEHLWRTFLRTAYGKDDMAGPDGSPCPTYRGAFCAWKRAFGPEYDPYIARAVAAWDRIKQWLAVHSPQALQTLKPGLSEACIMAAQEALGFDLPPALKVLYRIHDGQDLAFDERMQKRPGGPATDEELASIFHGMFGGYCVYDHVVCGRMLPLTRAIHWSYVSGLAPPAALLQTGTLAGHVPFATSFRVQDKMLVVDAASGGIHVVKRPVYAPMQRAAPPDSVPGSNDGVLRWFEEYSRRLASGMYGMALLEEELPSSRAICLFPRQPPLMLEEVTRGVRVRASVVYVPEQSPSGRHLFAYSIGFSLLPTEEQRAHWPATAGAPHAVLRCQLLSRHWVIRDGEGNQVDEVRGEAVIGKYPVLEAGGPEFMYQSCTHQVAPSGSMEGDFKFVEGTIKQRMGPEWDVICPRFELQVPNYIY